MTEKFNDLYDQVMAGTAVVGIGIAIKGGIAMTKRIIAYLKTSQLKLFWATIDEKIEARLSPLVNDIKKIKEDHERFSAAIHDIKKIKEDLHSTKSTQQAVQNETLRTLEQINLKLGTT